MTAIAAPSFAVSPQLRVRLREVARRRWWVLAAVGVFKTLIAGLLTLLAAVFLLGYFPNLWFPGRVAIALGAWVMIVAAGIRFLRPVVRRQSLSGAARQIEANAPGLHERLSSAIEISEQTDPAFRGSDELVEHLFRQAEADAATVLPQQVVPARSAMRWGFLFAPILIAWAIALLAPATTHTALIGLYRVLMPWKNALPVSLTQLSVTPGDIILAQGDSLDVSAHLAFGNSGDRTAYRATLVRRADTASQPVEQLTDDMQREVSGDFSLHMPQLQQGFSYRVSTSQCDSPWFSVVVRPRPQISSIDVRCDYPPYTGLAATVSSGGDGNIHAVVRTRVTLTLHTALPVVAGKSAVVLNDSTPEKMLVPLESLGGADYAAHFVVMRTGQYRIDLLNEFGLGNKEDQPQEVVAQPDLPPTVVIHSPEPQVSVGVDDTVPVKFTARDDFGVAQVDALLQVDNGPVLTMPVNFTASDKRLVTGQSFTLVVADVLKLAGATGAQSISYQLRVTDNRDPDPQTGLSAKQILRISQSAYEKFQTREDRKSAEGLRQAIWRAISQLNEEQGQVQPARDLDEKQSLEDWRRRQLHQAVRAIPKTSNDLASAADEAKDTALAEVARQVHDIAAGSIASAAEDASATEISADRGADRKRSATAAMAELTQARDQLQKLLNDQSIEKAVGQAAAARDLADAARKQQEAADLLKAQQQQNTEPGHQADHQQRQQQQQAMRDQEQANQRLQQAMQQAEALRDPQAQETARKLEELTRQVEQARKQQDALAGQTQKQQTAGDIAQKANEIARQQEVLNQDIAKSAEQNKDALQKANVTPPSNQQQQEIVKALDQNALQQAHERMNQAANQLHQAAQQLRQQANSDQLRPTDREQRQIEKDQHAVDEAKQNQDTAAAAANALKQSANAQQDAKQDSTQQAIAQAHQAAKEIEHKAADSFPRTDDAKKAADAAQQDAKDADHAAEQAAHADSPDEAAGHLNEAAKKLDQAGDELADAAKKNADAHRAEMTRAQQHAAAAAAEQAEHQAQQQEALARATQQPQQALAAVAQGGSTPAPDQTAQQQDQIARQTQDAQQQAGQLEHQAREAKNADVEARAQQANADLNQAHHHAEQAARAQERAAAQQHEAANADDASHAAAAEQNANRELAHAADEQHQAAQNLAKAQNELRGNPDADPQENDAGKPDAQASASKQAAQAAAEAAAAQQDASQQNQQAAQQAANALQRAARAMARATPGMHPGQPDQAADPGSVPGQQPADKPAHSPGQSPDSKHGIEAASAPVVVPASVLDIGITADQWAVLPPLQKKELMNAAQQSGPPGYRQMTKDYFAKIAKLSAQSAGQEGSVK
jgi:hypothetical protein